MRIKLIITLVLIIANLSAAAQNRQVSLTGKVIADMTNINLFGSKIYLLDSLGAIVDSTTVAKKRVYYGNSLVEIPEYRLTVTYKPVIYTIEATYPNYESGFMTVDLRTFGKRELSRELPAFRLKRAAKQLQEVVVTASKIKFYNKGDTLVFNADAFELADGSMLDALVQQLPGVELKENGQIFVNGKYVESLLLNGKEFIGNDNKLLLDNLGAYTVKDVAVYDMASDKERFLGQDLGESKYVMDVRMKKEFIGTYFLNLEAGYGTADRYMGRAFGMRSTATSQIMIAGSINNLNDTRRPGQNTTWEPEKLESGMHKEKQIRADYSFNAPDRSWEFMGNTILKHTSSDDEIFTDNMSFLPGGDNYSYTFNSTKGKNLWLGTAARYNRNLSKSVRLLSDLTLQYIDFQNRSAIVSSTFNKQQTNVTRQLLENIYNNPDTDRESIVNRNMQTDSTSNQTFRVFGTIASTIKIPKTNDNLYLSIDADYQREKPIRYNWQTINYGSDPTPAVNNSQFLKNSPRHNLKLSGYITYTYWLSTGYFQPIYELQFEEKIKDSQLYALDRLSDMGVFGNLPADYAQSYDPGNSYFGKHRETINYIGFRSSFPIWKFHANLGPSIQFRHQSLNYTQGDQHINKTRNSITIGSLMTHLYYNIGRYSDNYGMPRYTHSFDLELKANGYTPDMTWLIDIPYTADPLNILLGADKLKNEQHYDLSLTWKYSPKGSRLMESIILRYSNIQNALVRGIRYDSSTGVRTIRSYNVNGNWNTGITNNFSTPIGKVTLSSGTALDYGHTADMIGRDTEPTSYIVRNLFLSENLSLQYNPFKWLALTAKTNLQWRKTTSDESQFTSISAFTNNTGVTALFKLPYRFQISTDATLYARRGYGSPELNTTDFVWNARLAWTTSNKKWLLTLDGFDMLKQLSSINYAVNSQGRVITYRNVLPRYMMFHVQYKLNILPKKKK